MPSPGTPEPSPTPTSMPTAEPGTISPSDVLANPSEYHGKSLAVIGQTYFADRPCTVLVDGRGGVNLTGASGIQSGYYRVSGVYDSQTNTLEVIQYEPLDVGPLEMEAAKASGLSFTPVLLEGLVATIPKEVADQLATYLSIPHMPQDIAIYPYVVYAEDALYLVLSDHFDVLPTEFTFVYEGEEYHLYFSAAEVKGTLVKTPIGEIDLGPGWNPEGFGGVVIAEGITASDPVRATVREVVDDPEAFAFKRVVIDGTYLVSTATVDYSDMKLPFGSGILADSSNELLFEGEGPRLETIDPERKTWQLREGDVVGTVLYPTEEVLKYLDYSAPMDSQAVKQEVKPVLMVDTLVEDVAEVGEISQLNPITGSPEQFWDKVVEIEGYALGVNIRLKDVAEAITRKEVPVNVNLLAVGIADSPAVGSQLAIIGLNNDLLDKGGETIAGRFRFRVAVSRVPEELVEIESADTAFFLLEKEELPPVLPTVTPPPTLTMPFPPP